MATINNDPEVARMINRPVDPAGGAEAGAGRMLNRPVDPPGVAEAGVGRMLNRPVDPPGVAEAGAGFLERARGHWEEHGFGWWAVEGLEPDLHGELIGFVGVAYPTFLPELAARPEIGWRLAPRAWGRGLASEAARAAAEDAFTRLELPELISIIHPGNARSQRVATKLGMTLERQVDHPARGERVDVWVLAAPADAI